MPTDESAHKEGTHGGTKTAFKNKRADEKALRGW